MVELGGVKPGVSYQGSLWVVTVIDVLALIAQKNFSWKVGRSFMIYCKSLRRWGVMPIFTMINPICYSSTVKPRYNRTEGTARISVLLPQSGVASLTISLIGKKKQSLVSKEHIFCRYVFKKMVIDTITTQTMAI